MPSVLKAVARADPYSEIEFVEWSYGDWRPFEGQAIVWFTPETGGGVGLFAIGMVRSDAADAGRNAKGNRLVSFTAAFTRFNPREPLKKEHFRSLPRIGAGSPMQFLNRCLYINSHAKVAEIDAATFGFLESRF